MAIKKYLAIIFIAFVVVGSFFYFLFEGDVPTTYSECTQAPDKYHPPYDKPTPLECIYEVSQKEVAYFSRCGKLGGFINPGPASVPLFDAQQTNFSPEPARCELAFYNSNFVFPKTFEECLQVWLEPGKSSFKKYGTCYVRIDSGSYRINDKEIANYLLGQCIDAGGSYKYRRTQCIIEFTSGEAKVLSNGMKQFKN